jgi:transforming growth factor-beta-induced protein
MIKKSLIFVLLSALLGAIAFYALAQDAGVYEGKYTFSYPSGYEVTEGNDFLQLTNDTSTINVYGPESYARIIGGQTFDDNAAALEFFIDRAGLEVGDALTGDMGENQLAGVEVELPQRKQTGQAVLVDLDNGRKAVVVSLNGKDAEGDTAAMDEILGSLQYPADIVDVAMSNPDFSTLVAALQAAGLVDTLRDGEYTVFAPTNAAFENALKQLNMTAEEAMADADTLGSILQYHVIEGAMPAADLTSGWVTTLNGDQVDIQISRGAVRVNNSRVVQADVEAANGVIHVIDRVLLPPDLEAARLAEQFPVTLKRSTTYDSGFSFKYPTGAVATEGTGTVTLKSGRAAVTVYGPDAVNNLLGNNEVEGDAEKLAFFLDRLNAVEVGDAIDPLPENAKAGVNVSVPRFNQTGKAYLVDLQNGRTGVVVALAERDGYSLAYSDFVANQALSSLVYTPDIIDVASGNPEFSTLVAAIDAAGLTETLRDKSASYTVFAPTNAAFITALASMNMSVDDVMGNPELLSDILTYHVLPTAVTSADLVAGPVETVNTYPVNISITDGAVMVNDANVVQADIEAGNGVIHVIDKVLVPPLCFASTEAENVGVRVGPGENRSRVSFFPLEVKAPVTGQFTDEAGTVWYQVDKDVAAPGKQIREAWVLSTDVTTAGSGCAALPVVEMNQ